jgi:hypothetical protein
MDPVKLNHYRLAAENGFWKHMRTAFQDWLSAIMIKRYCDDFIRIRLSKGDGGLDGYRLSTQTVYQVFAPRDYTAIEMANKIKGDFAYKHLATEKLHPLPPTDPPSPRKLEFNELSEQRAISIQQGRTKQGLVASKTNKLKDLR